MADTLRVVAGDERPIVELTLTNEDSGAVIDLSDASTTVTAKFRATGATTTLSTISCSKLAGGSTGKVQFDFSGGVLDVDPGSYELEVLIDFDGDVQTVFDVIRVRVRAATS